MQASELARWRPASGYLGSLGGCWRTIERKNLNSIDKPAHAWTKQSQSRTVHQTGHCLECYRDLSNQRGIVAYLESPGGVGQAGKAKASHRQRPGGAYGQLPLPGLPKTPIRTDTSIAIDGGPPPPINPRSGWDGNRHQTGGVVEGLPRVYDTSTRALASMSLSRIRVSQNRFHATKQLISARHGPDPTISTLKERGAAGFASS